MGQVPRQGTLFIHSSRKIRGLSPQIVEHYNIECNWMDAMISDRSALVCEVPLCPQRVRFFFRLMCFCATYIIRRSVNDGG